jgi:AraC-like DNA-binding protein
MKIQEKKMTLEIISTNYGSSLLLKHLRAKSPCLKLSWHFHPEIELVYIPKGKGKLYISNVVKPYDNGVIILLHSNIPHRCFDFGFENEIYEEYLVQVLPEKLDQIAILFPEFDKIEQMLNASKQGIILRLQEEHHFFQSLFERLFIAQSVEQLLIFFEILHLLSKENYKGVEATLNTHIPSTSIERIDKVFNFIATHFMDDIRSQDVAQLLSFTNSSFCRFFQQHTQKTFKEALNEYRLAHACKLLAHTDKSIETVAYESGYGSQSFFNRMFKRFNGTTPLTYRSKWQSKK